MLAVVYLLYNQGRLPLLLFFVPFILDTKIAKKAKISFLIFFSGACYANFKYTTIYI